LEDFKEFKELQEFNEACLSVGSQKIPLFDCSFARIPPITKVQVQNIGNTNGSIHR